MQEPIHAYVRRLREARGQWLSQRKLAKLAGLAPSTILRLEGGQHAPSVETLTAIAPYLNTTADDLLERAGFRAVRPDALSALSEAHAPDPLMLLTQCLERGPWPQNISAAVYALLAAYADDKRTLWERRVNEAFDATLAELAAAPEGPEPPVYAGWTTEAFDEGDWATLQRFSRTRSAAQLLELVKARLFAPPGTRQDARGGRTVNAARPDTS